MPVFLRARSTFRVPRARGHPLISSPDQVGYNHMIHILKPGFFFTPVIHAVRDVPSGKFTLGTNLVVFPA